MRDEYVKTVVLAVIKFQPGPISVKIGVFAFVEINRNKIVSGSAPR